MHDQCPLTCHFCEPNEDGSVEVKNKTEGDEEREKDKEKSKNSAFTNVQPYF
jgi:hypothetical protein